MTKRRLLLVVGAGASIDFGMPSVEEAGRIINANAQKWFPLADRPETNLYKYIEGMVKRYWKKHVPTYLQEPPTFEDVLTIFELTSAYPAGAYTSPLGALIKVKKLPDIEFCQNRCKVSTNEITRLGQFALDALISEIRMRCQNEPTEFARLRSFVTALQEPFDLAIATVNYDNVLYRAVSEISEIETGFDPQTRRFHDTRIFGRRTWPCILHLHGSVHFDMPTPQSDSNDIHEIVWQPDIEANFAQNAFGRSGQLTEGGNFPTSVIIAGYGKTTQISLRRPFRTYYSELDRLVGECDAVLFAGYGFRDEHLNIAFEGFFHDDRRRPIAIIEKNDNLYLDHIKDRPGWVLQNKFNINLGPIGFCAEKTELCQKRKFDHNNDPQRPLSVWYFGMLEACDHPDKVIDALTSASCARP